MKMRIFYLFIFIFLMGVHLSLFFYATETVASEQEKKEKNEVLSQVWETRLQDLSILKVEAEHLNTSVAEKIVSLETALKQGRVDINRLLSLYQVSQGYPTEQLTLVYQLRRLRSQMKTLLQPLEMLDSVSQEKLAEVAKFKKDIESSVQGDIFSAPTSEDKTRMQQYSQGLSAAEQQLKQAANRTKKALFPARETLVQLDKTVTEIETGLPETWKNFYFSASSLSLDALPVVFSSAASWGGSLSTKTALAFPQGNSEWSNLTKHFLLVLFILLLVGAAAYNKANKLPIRWRNASHNVLTTSCVWGAVGISLLMASGSEAVGVYYSFVLLGVLFLIWGVGSLSWRLRLAGRPKLEGKPLPFSMLYPPAALGIFLLYTDFPQRTLALLWPLVMAAIVIGVTFINKKFIKEDGLPFLESLLYRCSQYVGILSLLVSLSGYPRLAVLLFIFLFAMANIVTLAAALLSLSNILADVVCDKERRPVTNAVLQSLFIPLSLILALLSSLPWQWGIPGASYLFQEVFAASYTIGAAHFNFSGIFFIVFLYFIIRAAINFGRTMLSHLPDRLPNIERGVIPPLKTLVTYGGWTIFLIISLGLLGVSLTSLAVIAGGLSVGIGFGMQNIFNNLVSGLLLIFGRTILVGDFVQIGATIGTVRDISIRSIAIETTEMALVYVPNSIVMSGQFTNWTRNNRRVQKSFILRVAYGTDLSLVAKLVFEAADKQENILTSPSPTVRLDNFGAGSLDFSIGVVVDDLDNAGIALAQFKSKILQLFDENGVDIPVPQMDVRFSTSEKGNLLEQVTPEK